MQNCISFCLIHVIIVPEGEQHFEKSSFSWILKKFMQKLLKLWGHYEHIQSPPRPTPSRKIFFDPLRILQNWGKNTPSQNLGLAGLEEDYKQLMVFHFAPAYWMGISSSESQFRGEYFCLELMVFHFAPILLTNTSWWARTSFYCHLTIVSVLEVTSTGWFW
jgi:hypothetical protein